MIRRPNIWLSNADGGRGRCRVRRLPYLLGHLGLDLVPILDLAPRRWPPSAAAIWPSNRLVMEAVTFAYMAASVR